MKKLILILVGTLLISSLAFGHEVSIYYPITEEDQKFWHLNQLRLYWPGDDYNVDLNLTPVIEGGALDVIEAWKKISLHEYVDLSIGKIIYAFGNVSSKASKNISILQATDVYEDAFGSDLMIKFSGELYGAGWSLYWADPGTGVTDAPTHIGLRGTYAIEGIDIGASFRMRDFQEDDVFTDFGLDLGYTVMEMVKLDFQLFNVADDSTDTPDWEDTDDLDLFFLASYVPGFEFPEIPVVKNIGKITPYLGFFSKREITDTDDPENPVYGNSLQENNMIFGVNLAPKDDAFIKLEYNIDSVKDDILKLQVGFTF